MVSLLIIICRCDCLAGNDIRTLIEAGETHFENGRFEDAVKSLEHALGFPNADPALAARALACLSASCQSLGLHKRALDAFAKMRPPERNGDPPIHDAVYHAHLGDLYLTVGDRENAIRHLETAEDIAVSHKDIPLLAGILNNIANALFLEGDAHAALPTYAECLELIAETGAETSGLKSKASINALKAIREVGAPNDLMKALGYVHSDLSEMPDNRILASDLVSLGIFAADIGNAEGNAIAHRSFERAKRIGKSVGDTRIISSASGQAGRLYKKNGRLEEALALTREAVFHARTGNNPEILYLWQWQAGQIFEASGDIENAVAAYQASVATLDPIRMELLREHRTTGDSFALAIRPVYLGLARLYLRQAEAANGDLGQEMLKNARDTMELLKTAELEDFFEDECVTGSKTDISATEGGRHAVIYPILFPDSLALLFSFPDDMKHIRVRIDADTLISKAKRFRKLLQTGSGNRFMAYAKMLYDRIIRPAENDLERRGIDTLIVAPDSALRLIPFGSLHNGKRFLVERFTIVTVPAITLTEPGPVEFKGAPVLLGGLSEARENFSPLPAVREELDNIHALAGGKILRDNDYTLANLKGEFTDQAYSLVHMATHGMFGGTPADTFLLVSDGRLTMDGLEQLINLGKYRDTQLELLTLSACQTALGDDRAALGLAGVAVKAGAGSAIATLWSVDDRATSQLIHNFYRELFEKEAPKARALRNSQIALIRSEEYRHPTYWAPFLLIGNWM